MTATSQGPDSHNDQPTRRDWLLALYGFAREDTRWAKERSWQALALCYTLLGGLLALRINSFPHTPPLPFILFVALTACLSIWYLRDLHTAAAEARCTSRKIKDKMPEDISALLPKPDGDKNHDSYLIAQISCIVLAAIVTGIALCAGI